MKPSKENQAEYVDDIIKKYPELDSIAEAIANNLCDLINRLTKDVKSKARYKAQYTLEEVIEILQGRV